MWIFLALLAVPVIEIGLFIQVGGLIGLWPTLGIVVLTAVLGTMLLRVQGMRALGDLRTSIGTLSDPTGPLANGAMILVAGVLLMTPGFFTDAVGLALLIPWVRTLLIARLRGRVSFAMASARPGASRGPDAGTGRGRTAGRAVDGVIDGDFTEVPPHTGDDRPAGTDHATRRPTHPPSGWTRH